MITFHCFKRKDNKVKVKRKNNLNKPVTCKNVPNTTFIQVNRNSAIDFQWNRIKAHLYFALNCLLTLVWLYLPKPASLFHFWALFIQMTTNPKFVLHIKSLANHANLFIKCHTAKKILNREVERPDRRTAWTRLMKGNTKSSFVICYHTASNTCLPLSKERDNQLNQ